MLECWRKKWANKLLNAVFSSSKQTIDLRTILMPVFLVLSWNRMHLDNPTRLGLDCIALLQKERSSAVSLLKRWGLPSLALRMQRWLKQNKNGLLQTWVFVVHNTLIKMYFNFLFYVSSWSSNEAVLCRHTLLSTSKFPTAKM
jgi:hypothetical protein